METTGRKSWLGIKGFYPGYGPEVYLPDEAMEGEYQVWPTYGSQAQRLSGVVTFNWIFIRIMAALIRKKSITVRLSEKEEVLTIGTLKFKKKQWLV